MNSGSQDEDRRSVPRTEAQEWGQKIKEHDLGLSVTLPRSQHQNQTTYTQPS